MSRKFAIKGSLNPDDVFKDKVDVEIVRGGYGNVEPLNSKKDYIKQLEEELEQNK